MFIHRKLFALVALFSAVCALPSSVPELDTIPRNVASIAYDTDLDVIIAYDAEGNILGQLPASVGRRNMKRDAGPCVNMSGDDIQRLRGWDKLAQYAKDSWGDGWDTIDANPKEYPASGAILCIAGEVTPVAYDGLPECRSQTQSSAGSIVGANGTVTLSTTQGTTVTTGVTVMHQSELAVGSEISAKFGIPPIEVTASFSVTLTLINSQSTQSSFTTNNAQTQTVTIQNEAGKTCSLTVDVRSCDVSGSGSIRMLASGWVWVYYGERRQGHYKWAFRLDGILSEEERETFIEFKTSISSNTFSQYHASCK